MTTQKYVILMKEGTNRLPGFNAVEINGRSYSCDISTNNKTLAECLYNEYILEISREAIKRISPLNGGKVVKRLELKVTLLKENDKPIYNY